MSLLAGALTLLAAYLVGAIPFGYLIARWKGVDIFAHGSGNIGATNVSRILGRPFGVLVFALDCAKGAGPVCLALALKPSFDDDLWTRGYLEVAAGLTAFLGHLFPVYLKFRGGKGVATGLGAVVVLMTVPAALALAAWIVVVSASRTVSLASLTAVLAFFIAHFRLPESWSLSEPRTWFCLIVGGLVVVKHRANIGRLWYGTENQMKENAIMQQFTKSLHVCALGLWFGMTVFFTFVAALSLLNTFQTLGKSDKHETWFPRSPMYQVVNDDLNGREEQGTRAFGHAVTPLFTWYFAIQGACGFIALVTALPWLKLASRVHWWRVNLLIAAVVCVMLGWPVERKVSELRNPRNETTEAYLMEHVNANKVEPETTAKMKEARAEFGKWHTYSLLLNFATILCVTAAMAMAGNLSDSKPKEDAPK